MPVLVCCRLEGVGLRPQQLIRLAPQCETILASKFLYVCMYVCMYVCIYIYIYIYIFIIYIYIWFIFIYLCGSMDETIGGWADRSIDGTIQ